VQAHLAKAVESHRRNFGMAPKGMWPSEGSVSRPALELLGSRDASGPRPGRPCWHTVCAEKRTTRSCRINPRICISLSTGGAEKQVYCFFRDDHLSDRIGFEYAKWRGDDAAADFIHQLEEIHRHAHGEHEPVVSVILDGENAWEYYPYNAYYFLSNCIQNWNATHILQPPLLMNAYKGLKRALDRWLWASCINWFRVAGYMARSAPGSVRLTRTGAGICYARPNAVTTL